MMGQQLQGRTTFDDVLGEKKLSVSAQLTNLISEMDELEEMAASFQVAPADQAKHPSTESVATLRRAYLGWYERSKRHLNENGKRSFYHQYAKATYNIHDFIGDPSGTYYAPASTYGRSRGGYEYNHNFKRYFKKPFNEQRLLLMGVEAAARVKEEAPPPPPTPPAFDTIRLHSRVRAVSAKLFTDGHYRQAILDASIAIIEAVQQRSGRTDLDGTKLMQEIFSANNPILKFDGSNDKQLGMMWLFSGMAMGVRNPRGHKIAEYEDLDANEALEVLALISFLFRALDTTTKADAAAASP